METQPRPVQPTSLEDNRCDIFHMGDPSMFRDETPLNVPYLNDGDEDPLNPDQGPPHIPNPNEGDAGPLPPIIGTNGWQPVIEASGYMIVNSMVLQERQRRRLIN